MVYNDKDKLKPMLLVVGSPRDSKPWAAAVLLKAVSGLIPINSNSASLYR